MWGVVPSGQNSIGVLSFLDNIIMGNCPFEQNLGLGQDSTGVLSSLDSITRGYSPLTEFIMGYSFAWGIPVGYGWV